MKLYLANRLTTLEDVKTFFRAAYLARFGKDADVSTVSTDVTQYTTKGTIPPYVECYVSQIQQKAR